jgi:hypothetical protein
VFGRCSVWISAGTPNILRLFLIFLCLQANTRISH